VYLKQTSTKKLLAVEEIPVDQVMPAAGWLQYPAMDIQSIVSELRDQRDRIQQAIDALERTTPSSPTGKRRGRKPRKHMSADARRRIGLAMKKRWAERKGKKAA
jgi:hypothetical protein